MSRELFRLDSNIPWTGNTESDHLSKSFIAGMINGGNLFNYWRLKKISWHRQSGTHKRSRRYSDETLGVVPYVFGSRSFLKCTLSYGLLNTVRIEKALLSPSSCLDVRTFA